MVAILAPLIFLLSLISISSFQFKSPRSDMLRRPHDSFRLTMAYGRSPFSKELEVDPTLTKTLSEMPFSAITRRVLEDRGFERMTPIQSQVFESVVSGLDVVARSRTGTGKTLAFGIPMIEKLVSSPVPVGMKRTPRLLILEPTRELALQVVKELETLCAGHGLRITCLYGGVALGPQEMALRNGVDIIVGTPGRIMDHISRQTMVCDSIDHLVLDEGDTMLEMGFQESVESILTCIKNPGTDPRDSPPASGRQAPFSNQNGRDIQVLLFSATIPQWINRLISQFMKTPVYVNAVLDGETKIVPTIKHYSMTIPGSGNSILSLAPYIMYIINTYANGGQTLVFTKTKDEANMLMSYEFAGLSCGVLHGDISQAKRTYTIDQFKRKDINVLIATDVAARGLDIPGVDLIIQAGPPQGSDNFVHRAGRTGRAGRNGTNVVLSANFADERTFMSYQREHQFKFEPLACPSKETLATSFFHSVVNRVKSVKHESVVPYLPMAAQFLQSLPEINEQSSADLIARFIYLLCNPKDLEEANSYQPRPNRPFSSQGRPSSGQRFDSRGRWDRRDNSGRFGNNNYNNYNNNNNYPPRRNDGPYSRGYQGGPNVPRGLPTQAPPRNYPAPTNPM